MTASGNYITESDVDNWPIAVQASENFATTAVNVSTNQITVANDIATCTELRFSSTGVLPSPLVDGVIYYAIRVDATHIKVAANPVNAAAGTAVDLTDVGSGTHTLDIGSGSSEADRQETIDRAEQLIERITRDYFYTKSFLAYCSGNDKSRLFVGLAADILSVSEIKISGVILADSWWTYDKNSVYLDPEATAGEELPELLLRRKYGQRLFPRGLKNIKITGTCGWQSCPPAIKRAAIILCRYENDSALYSAVSGNFKSEKIGDYSYTLADEVTAKELTGIGEVDDLLRAYIRKKPMLGAM